MSSEKFIDYGMLVDEAMHQIVKKSLEFLDENHFVDGHHFFISFATKHIGVVLSEKLLAKYPEEMTIVLQHQFEDLVIDNDKFAITLSFDGIKERIIIPYKALTAFADPAVKFGLQFRHYHEDNEVYTKQQSEKHETSEEVESDIQEQKNSNVINFASYKNKK